MPNTATQQFILFRTGETGPDLVSAAETVEAAADVNLVRRNRSALLIEGEPESVETLTKSLPGWASEPNQRVRGGV
jgi:hypothetical protein